MSCDLLLETGGRILQEDGFRLLLENCVPAVLGGTGGGALDRRRHLRPDPFLEDDELVIIGAAVLL